MPGRPPDVLARPTETLAAQPRIVGQPFRGTPYGAHAIPTTRTHRLHGAIGVVRQRGQVCGAQRHPTTIARRSSSTGTSCSQATLTSVTGYDYGWWYEKSDDGGLP